MSNGSNEFTHDLTGYTSGLSGFSPFPLTDLLDAIDTGVIAIDLSGNVLYGNAAAMRKFGLDQEWRWSGPVEQFAGRFELTTLDGEPIPFEQWPLMRFIRGETASTFEAHVRRIDHRWSATHRYTAEVVRRPDSGASIILITVKDISDRSRLEEQLRQRVEEYQTLMDMAPIGLYICTDPKCEYIVGNRFANALYQAAPGENLSAKATAERRFFRNGRELATEQLPMQKAVAENVAVENMELEVRIGDDTRFDILCSATPLHDREGAVRGCVAGLLDITKLKRTEAALSEALATAETQRLDLQESNRELETFSYSVSHDLQGPLRAINGYAHALYEDCHETLDDLGRTYLQRIQQSSLRMGELTNALLGLSQIARRRLEFKAVDLGVIAGEVVNELTAGEPEREIDFDIGEELTAVGDEPTLRLLMQNLLSNAWKYTAAVPAALIRFRRVRVDGKRAFVVEDNGVGFEMQYATKLFKPFERLHAADAFQGTGIGLATARRIIQRHGGEIWAESAPDRGAAFFFTLPQASGG